MIDLKFGDICIADLSRSLNVPKNGIAPLVYMSSYRDSSDVVIYKFCRVGKQPEYQASRPYVPVGKHSVLRAGSAVYPTSIALISDETAILSKAGAINNEEVEKRIRFVCDEARKEESQAIVMTLCKRCRKEFLLNPETIVKRLDPYEMREDQCDFCQTRNGHVYVIYKRKLYGGIK